MWGKLLSDTYQKVRTKADEVREQVSSAVQAQQATISKAREVLLSLGGGGGSAATTGSLSRGGADAFAAAAAAAHLSAEDVQRLLQREAGEIRTLDEARDIFTTWRQLILQSGLRGSPRFTSSGEQQTDEEQHQQRRWSAGSSKSRKDGAEQIAAASAAEHEEEAEGSRRVRDAAVAGKEKKAQQIQPYRAEGSFSFGAGAAGASPAAEQHRHMQHVADAEGREGLEEGGEVATASSARPLDHPQQHPITRAPSLGSSAAAVANTYPQMAAAGTRPVDAGATHSSVTVHHPTVVGGVVPAAATAPINYAVVIPRPMPPTFAAALEEEAARGERSCFLDGFSFKEIFLRSTALERALLSLARKETLRAFFAAHVLELLLAVKKQHKEQQQQVAEGGEAKKEVTAAGSTGGDGRSEEGRAAAGARAEGEAATSLETVREGGVKGKEAAEETKLPRVIGSESGAPATAAGGGAAAAAEAADATTTASPSSQTSHVSSSSGTTTTEDSSSSVDEASNGIIKTADKQSAEEQKHHPLPQQGHDQHRGGTAAGGEVKPAGGGMALHHHDVATSGAAAPPPPPVVSTLLALLSLCSPGTQEQHLMLLHALFTVATAAAPPAASLESTLQQQQKQQRQLLREFYASGGQRTKGVLLASASRHSSRSRALEQQKQQDKAGGAQQQQPRNGALRAGRASTEAASGSVTQRAADGSTLSANGFTSAASSEVPGAAGKHGQEDSSQGSAALDSHVAAATEEQQHREGSNTCSASAGSAAAPFSSGSGSEECTATQQEALAALERVLLLFSLWKRSWLLERREDARRRLEEEGRHLAAKIESCDLPVDGADAVPTDASDSAPADPLVSHNIRLLANAQLLRLQQQVLLLKEELLQEQRATAAEKVRRLRELQGVWEKQDAAAAARQVTGGEQEIQDQMAKASEVLIQEAGLVEERRVALHQKLKSLQEKKLLLEQELADCLQMIAAAEREQQKLLFEEEDVRVELLHVQMQYKQQVQQHLQQQQQQARLQQALQDLDSTAADLADYAVLDARRREAAATADIQRVQGALQTQVCRHFAFEKTRLQQQAHLLQHHMQVLEQLLKEQQQHSEERMGDEQRLQLLHARRRFIRAAHQLDVMYGETLSFAEQHRRILALAIRQQWQTLRGKTNEQQQHNEGEKAGTTAAGNNSVLQKEQLARRKGELEEQIDPMKDIKAIYTTTKKQLAPYIAQLASSTAASAEGQGAQEVRRASAVQGEVPAASAGEAIPAAGGKAAADAWVSGENVARSPAHALRPHGRLSQGEQQQQSQQQDLQKLHPQGQEGTLAEKRKECAAGATAVGAVREKGEEQQGRSLTEARRLSEAAGGVPLLVERGSDPAAFLQRVQWQQQAEEGLSPSQRHIVQQHQHTGGQQEQMIPPQHRFEQQEQSQQPALQQEPHEGAGFQFLAETGRKQEATQLFHLTTPPSSPTASPRFNRDTQLPAAAEQHGSMPQQHSNTLERPGFSCNLQLFDNEQGPLQQQQQHFSNTSMQQSLQEQQCQRFLESEEPEQPCTGKQQSHPFSIGRQQSNFRQPPPPVQAEKKEQMEEDGDNGWLL